ncbi:glycine betaine ABC transporter substrate-binding protein, partial [Bacillus pumilus]|uniref:glycine betaine ABC transporter substrate-binding protein n=1 Tax=Bacillus pumilus TaxID=1408 RepID=UPI0036F48E0D
PLTHQPKNRYPLHDSTLLSPSTTPITPTLNKSYHPKNPIIITPSNPHSIFSRYHLKYLHHPKKSYRQPQHIHTISP